MHARYNNSTVVQKKNSTRAHKILVIYQFPRSLVLQGGGSNPRLLGQELVVVCLLEVEFHILERLALAKIVVVLPMSSKEPYTHRSRQRPSKAQHTEGGFFASSYVRLQRQKHALLHARKKRQQN